MYEYAINKGINKEDIIIEDKSSNTRENIINVIELLHLTSNDKVMLITSEFHLKRCDAILRKIIPGIKTILVKAEDGIHDKDKWFLYDNILSCNGKHGSGKTLVTNEARLLIECACNKEIDDLDINGYE